MIFEIRISIHIRGHTLRPGISFPRITSESWRKYEKKLEKIKDKLKPKTVFQSFKEPSDPLCKLKLREATKIYPCD